MRRRDKLGGKAVKAHRRKTLTGRNAPKAARGGNPLAPDQETNVADLTRELFDVREQQMATAEILRVIRASPADAQPVFQTIVRNAVSLCGGLFANVFSFDGELLHYVASHDVGPSYADMIRANYPMRPDSSQVSGRVVLAKSVVWLGDALADPDYDQRYPRAMGWRRLLGVPMLHEGNPIGAITVGWAEPGPASKVQEELLKTFADQAVIAVENVRSFEAEQERTRELTEALEHQMATSEVLNVISRSPTNVQPVFNAIVESASRLCQAGFGVVWRYDGDLLHYAASHNFTPEVLDRIFKTYPKQPDRSLAAGRAILDGKIAHVPDMLADPGYAHELARAGNWRASIAVPMLRNGKPIGAISVGKAEAGPFSERQMQLLSTFADQAVIAIENVRLFNETQEALEQQTATSEVLKVISSSPGDLQPVFDAILANATDLCGARFASLRLSEGDQFRTVSLYYAPTALVEHWRSTPLVRPHP